MQNLIEQLLIKNNYTNFNRQDLKLQFLSHPESPSFLAITDTLNYFGIENLAASVEDEALDLLPKNFLTIINDENPSLVLVGKNSNSIIVKHENNKSKSYNTENFLKIWSKKIIAIEPIEKSKSSQSIGLLYVFALIISLTLFLLNGASITESFLLILSAVGLFISFLLVREKLGKHSSTVTNLCNTVKQSSCNDVINSKGAKLFGRFDLSDICFIYFGTLTGFQVFFGWNVILSYITLSSIPVILYSIYYQAFKIKSWCILCLAVSLVLFLSALIVYFQPLSLEISIINVCSLLLMTLLIGIPYHLTKSLYTLNHSLTQNNIELKKFKRNIKIFKFFFSNSRHIENIRPIHNEVVLGNPNASFEIVGVTNPLCGYCKAAFESYMKILKSDSEDLCIRLRFNSGSQFKDQTHVKISFRLMEIYFENGHKGFIEALKYWYENKDIDDWFKNYGLPDFNKIAADVLSSQKDWLDHNKLNYTPATFLNNVLYPKEYSYDEFPFFISELIESRD